MVRNQCSWKSEFDDLRECTRERYKDSEFCIFHEPHGDKNAEYFKEQLDKELSFLRRPGHIQINLVGTIFPKGMLIVQNFEVSKGQSVIFNRAILTENAEIYFGEAKLEGVVLFFGAKLAKNAKISFGVNLGKGASALFGGTSLAEGAGIHFGGELAGGSHICLGVTKLTSGSSITFYGAKIGERAEILFDGATAERATISFMRSRFLGEFEFASLKTIKGKPLIDFCDAVFLEPEHVHFYGIDLETTRFLNAKTLNRIKFNSVKWGNKKETVVVIPGILKLSKDRKEVYDEEMFYKQIGEGIENPPYEEVENLYRQLKDNYEYQRNYPDAGDFYIGEMEMRRLNPKTGRLERLLLTLYRYLSLYGEDYRLAFVWICALIVLSGAAMLLTGFTLDYGSFKATVPNHEIALGFPELGHVLNSLLVALKMVTFQREGIVSLSSVGVFVQTLTSIFGVFLLAIFGLALRRRFRR